MTFKDHFSGHAAHYASSRPLYSDEIFDFVATLPEKRSLALDCATGNGQAAVGLAERFERVIATDASAEQLSHATPHPRVEYRQAPAEQTGVESGTVDLVTAAAGAHWFDFDRFYPEVERVLAPGGALAVWSYDLLQVSPEIDRLVRWLAREGVASYWPPERRWVDEEYRTLPFPFQEVEVPPLAIEALWPLDRVLGYIGTWSASARYRRETGRDAVELIRRELEAAWGDPGEERLVRWPIMMRAGYPKR
jgi:SAM-dependent methyltransferase